MVRPVGVGRSRPPLGVPIEINKSGAGFFYNPTPHIQTQAPKRPLRITGKTVIIGVGAVILLCGRNGSRIGAWGIAVLHVLPLFTSVFLFYTMRSNHASGFLYFTRSYCFFSLLSWVFFSHRAMG